MSRQTKPRVMYMHTLDGQPATFDVLFQVIHRVPVTIMRSKQNWLIRLAKSLDHVMAERRMSRRSLRREGKPIPRYGYVRVEIPS